MCPKPQSKLPLSVIIITHRQDQRFYQAQKSAQFAQEVLIVKPTQPISDFAQVRNQALKQAQHNWVLFLDSDEIIDAQSIAQLKTLLTNPDVQAYTLKRTDVFLNQALTAGEAYQQHLIRLMKKQAAHFQYQVHEQAVVKGLVQTSNLQLWHYAHQSLADFWQKITYYAKLKAQELTKENFSKSKLIWQLLTYPPAKFINNFFIKQGFRDRWRGLVYATMMSLHSLMVRIYLYELKKSPSAT
ncbi:MAG: glycosyltransferase [Candidatus Pacebacteria bacterium]|nr:glycosyltransferase [Candidatus Paceibacterota bacterium]